MRLVQEGKLSLDAPVERYLIRWHLPSSSFDNSGVTIRRLLSHIAGLSVPGYLGIAPGNPLPTLEQSLSGRPEPPAMYGLSYRRGPSLASQAGATRCFSLFSRKSLMTRSQVTCDVRFCS